jgi:iron uptake system EfeUOB component EfeO/EfeM
MTKKFGIMAIAAMLVVMLAACGSAAIADGSKKMQNTLTELKKSVDSGDAAKVKQGASALEESWEKFEDGVKDKDKALYEKVEDPLHAIEAGAKADKLDAAALNKSITELGAALDEVAKLK